MVPQLLEDSYRRHFRKDTYDRRLCASAALVVLLLIMLQSSPAQEKTPSAAQNPQFSMFYSYRCSAERRPDLRKYMETTGAAQFEHWKSQGIVMDYMILFSSYVRINSVPWDMLVRIDFNRYADTEKWKQVEHSMPAGLPPQILAFTTPDNLNVGQTLGAGGMEPTNAAHAIYDVSYYRFKVPLAAGKDFVQGYVMPQLESFLREAVLSGYGIYMNQYEGTDWSYLILSEYSDAKTFELRVANKSKIRTLFDPAWKALNDIKSDRIRDEPHGFIAERIVPH